MTLNTDSIQSLSLSVASLPEISAVAVGFSQKVIYARLSDPNEVLVIDDAQIVRNVALMKVSGNGPICVVTGGDRKRINVYNVSASACSSGQRLEPLFTFGPHSKRITHVLVCDDSSILFADKFGEVFRLDLAWGPNHTLPSGDARPVFLLQHFSTLTSVLLTSPAGVAGRRLVTCDKDRHARVSRYPDAFRIERFLWAPTPQSPVTCLAELPAHGAVAVGCQNGRVHLWAAGDGWARRDGWTAGDGAVLAAAAVAGGLLLVHAAARRVTFLPLLDGQTAFDAAAVCRAELRALPAAVSAVGDGAALVWERSGGGRLWRPRRGAGGEWALEPVGAPPPALCAAALGVLRPNGRAALDGLDLFAQWNYEAADPRARRGGGEREESGEEESAEDDRTGTARGAEKRQREGANGEIGDE